MSGVIRIHEFSTGIEIFGTPDYWYVGGFTGKYINSTMSSIPRSVKDAISGGYFKMAEGKSSSKSSVIGREIIISDIEQWSVVAVVTKGQEESGRTASLYRYFLTKEINNIGHILQWMNQEKSGLLAFNPFDKQEIGYPHQYQTTSSKLNLKPQLQNLLSQSPPIIVPYDEPCVPLILNEMAHELDNPKSWAFNVTGLDKARNFQIIQPADDDSEKTIRQIISKTPKQPQFQGQEGSIKKAIKGLINKTFNSEYLEILENSLSEDKFNEEQWKHLFDSQGANDAIRNETYTSQMVKLLTLQAMVLPGTLPEFLKWIEQANNPDSYDISSIFQSEIFRYSRNNSIANLRERIIDGVKYIISHLVEDPELVNSTIKLLTDEQGIWKHYYKTQVMLALDYDFKLLSQYHLHPVDNVPYKIFNHPRWQRIYDSLKNFWQPTTSKDEITKYQAIANLFDKTNQVNKTRQELRLYALFQYASQRIIPNSLFNKLKKNLINPQVARGLYINVYGLWIERQVPLQEKLYVATLQIIGKISDLLHQLWKSKIPFPWLIVIMSIYTPAIFGIDSVRKKVSLPSIPKFNIPFLNRNPETKKAKNKDMPQPQPTKSNVGNAENIKIPDDKLQKALNQFEQTKKVIKEEIYQLLVQEFNSTLNKLGQPNNHQAVEQEIKIAIKKTLIPNNKPNIQYNLVIEKDSDDQEEIKKWIKAIYAYQQRKKQEVDSINIEGFLVPITGQTNKYLIEDVRKNVSKELKSRNHE